jgi:hypothetical protein
MGKIRTFIDDCTTEYKEFNLSLRAGYIDEDGIICNAQMGAIDTFSVGMPVYDDDGVELGRLSIGLWKNLNWSQDKIDIEIPVHHWRVDGYKGKQQTVKTWHQLKQQQTNGGSE